MTQNEFRIAWARKILGKRFEGLSDKEIEILYRGLKSLIIRVIDTHIPAHTLCKKQ